MGRRYRDRSHAGEVLAESLGGYADDPEAIVLALPRGGVPVGAAVARALHLPLDMFLVRKLGAPGREELAMGAIGSGGVQVVNDDVVRELRIPKPMLEAVTAREYKELVRREHAYRGDRPPLQLEGKTALLVDDGLATGSSMRAAIEGVKRHGVARVVVAVPVGVPQVCGDLQEEVDDVVCVLRPLKLIAVGFWYQDFSQTSDQEVASLLHAGAFDGSD